MENSKLDARIEQVMKDHRRDYPRLERELRKCLKEAEKGCEITLIGKISLYLCICYFEMGDRVRILSHAIKAVGIFENSDDKTLLARSYNLLGIAYGAQENFQLSLASFNKALDTTRGLRNPFLRKEMILNNIADCYYQMGEYQKSIRLMKGCLSTCKKKTPDNHSAISIYGLNLSDCYESLGELQQANEILDSVETDIKTLGEDSLVYGFYARRSVIYYRLGDLKKGAEYADLTLTGMHIIHDVYEFHRDFEKIVSLEVQANDCHRAQKFADILSEYAESHGYTYELIIAKRAQASIFDSCGDRTRSLELYKELNDLYEKRVREQNAMQYESQKNAEAASREIAKLLKKIRISEEKAERDPLTGLLNRSALVSITNEFVQNAKNRNKKLGGIFLDIDYFKEYNDTYGHAAGDEVIKYIARVCLSEETSSVRFFRYGGDEYFGVILGHKDEDVQKLALRISDTVRSASYEHVKNPNGQRLTVSIGVVNVDMKNSDYTILDIIRYSDKALYHAKDRGKDVVFAYHALANSEHEYRRVCDKA